MSAPEIRAWSADDGLLADAFGDASPGGTGRFVPRGAAAFEWAFARNPGGSRLFLARADGRTRASFASLSVRTRVPGEVRSFACVLDSYLAPGEPPATLETAARRAIEAAATGDLVQYGWPTGADAALARASLGFELLRRDALLAREVGPGPSDVPEGVQPIQRFGPEVDHLYACCATHWNASAVRDAAFLNWRFLAHPFHRYAVFGLMTAGVLRGYVAYRAGPELRPGLGLLMDWLVLPGDTEAEDKLLAAVLACARADGSEALAGVVPEWSPWSLHFQERGFRHHASGHALLARASAPRFDMLWLRDAWWNTLADALIL